MPQNVKVASIRDTLEEVSTHRGVSMTEYRRLRCSRLYDHLRQIERIPRELTVAERMPNRNNPWPPPISAIRFACEKS